MTKLKAGDVITVKTESVVEDFRQKNDFDAVEILTEENPDDSFSNMRELSKKSVYQIVKNDAHEDLRKFNVNLGHFSLKAIKIKAIAFPDDDFVRINGSIDIPYNSKRVRLSDAYFLDENEAWAIAIALNKEQMERFKDLKKAVEQAEVLMEQIVNKKLV